MRKVIGKVKIAKSDALLSWLNDEKTVIKYTESNWSKACSGWEDSEKIGFFDLRNTVPFLQEAINSLESSWKRTELMDEIDYYSSMDISFGLIYTDDKFTVFCSANNYYLLPSKYLDIELYMDYENVSMSNLRLLTGTSGADMLPAELNDVSIADVKEQINEKKDMLKRKQKEIEDLEEEKRAELEAFKRELEEKFKDKMELLNAKMDEFNEMKEHLEKQIFVLESEIYGIRCYTGEVVDFKAIKTGKNADKKAPLVVYQKLRYLDEELGKIMSIYGFEGSSSSIEYFEELLKSRSDIQELFAPGEKSLSVIKISRSGEIFASSDVFANILKSYKKYHGQTLALLLKNGDNIWISWLDEERISIKDGFVFFNPKEQSISSEDEYVINTSVDEKLSRYYIFSILQGICDSGKLISFPEKINVMTESPYVVFSMADNWLINDKYGDISDIIKRTESQIKKGDMVLTMQRITRDDIYGRNVYASYNNDRGRGDKNRTHDVSISNCTIYPINQVDVTKVYAIYSLEYPYAYDTIETPSRYGGYHLTRNFTELQGPPRIHESRFTSMNDMFRNDKIKNLAPNMDDFFEWFYGNFRDGYKEPTVCDGRGVLYKYLRYEVKEVEYEYFISEEKDPNWRTGKSARANMQVYKDEILNLTFLNSVYVRYAIVNNKVKNWRIGGKTIDFSYAIRYLNTALAYLDEREKEEAAMLSEYMDLYSDWQVDVSEWRLKKGYHRLTPTRAKAFAQEHKLMV